MVSKGPKWYVKIGDFGISKHARPGRSGFHSKVGTPGFLAPEILGLLDPLDQQLLGGEHHNCYTVAVDMWCLGQVIYCILTGTQPFSICGLIGYARGESNFPLRTLQDKDISEEGQDFVKKLLAARPSNRLTAEAATLHPWIHSFLLWENYSLQIQMFVHLSPGRCIR